MPRVAKATKAPPLCYICAQPIESQDRSRDHVPPLGLFNPADRQNLRTLPTHKACNEAFALDDEYFRLCLVAAVAHHNTAAKNLFDDKVMRGFHRPDHAGLKSVVLKSLVPAEVRSKAGLILGKADAMMQDSDRILRVVNRITRGLYTIRTGKVLPADWPVSSDMIDPTEAQPFLAAFQIRFFDVGNGTFLYDSKHLPEDDREALFWLVFYRSVHFWGYTGTKIPAALDQQT